MSLTKIDTTIKELAEAIKEEQIYMDVIGKICKVEFYFDVSLAKIC